MSPSSFNIELREGTPVLIRTVQPEDKHLLEIGMVHPSKESRYSRFFHPVSEAAGFVAASGGTLIVVTTAAIISGAIGAAVSIVLAAFLTKEHTERVTEHLLHGGLLLWVRTWDQEHECRAVDIRSNHGADDVHLHKRS